MNFSYVKRGVLLFFSALVLLLAACTKIITTDIGSGLLPPSDSVTTKDTFITVYTKNAGDSAIYIPISDDHVLGYVNNNIFGQTQASISVQFQPSYFPYALPVSEDSITVDSAVLILHYNGIWGDSLQPLSLRVFQIDSDQPFTADSVYSTNKDFAVDQELTYNNTPVSVNPLGLLTRTYHAFADSGVSSIRIRLNDSIANLFLKNYTEHNIYASDSLFNTYFKGFKISSDLTGNSLFKINLLDAGTKLALYFKYQNPDSTGVKDTSVRYFYASAGISASANSIHRNRSGSQYASYYPSANAQDDLLFLESNPGNFANISIPDLSRFRNVLILRAELLMGQVPDISDTYFPPPALVLTGYDADSLKRIALLSDITDLAGNLSLTSFGSFPISTFSNNSFVYSYNFNISRYVQGIVTRHDSNYHQLALYAPFYTEPIYASPLALSPFTLSTSAINNPACGRVRLAGGNYSDSTKRMRLHIVYSLLK